MGSSGKGPLGGPLERPWWGDLGGFSLGGSLNEVTRKGFLGEGPLDAVTWRVSPGDDPLVGGSLNEIPWIWFPGGDNGNGSI
jgi:hypothetical protein